MNTYTKGFLPSLTIISVLAIVNAGAALAAGESLRREFIDEQCDRQYGVSASASHLNPKDAKSWKCVGIGNPQSISMSRACKLQNGNNYYAAIDKNSPTLWRCVRKGI